MSQKDSTTMRLWSSTASKLIVTVICLICLFGGRSFAQASADEASGASGSPAGYYYVYDGRRIALEVDQSRLAVKFSENATRAARATALSLSGLDPAATEPVGVDTWQFAYTSLDPADPDQFQLALDQILQSPEVAFVSPIFAPPTGGWMTVTPEILIRLNVDGSGNTILNEIEAEANLVETNFGQMDRAYRLKSKSRNGLEVLNLANRLAEDPRVEWAEPDMLASVDKTMAPNDPGWPSLWGLNNTGQSGGTVDMDMDCDLAWDISAGTPDVLILVLDDGVDLNHPDLNIAGAADFTNLHTNGHPGNNCDNHGTAVSGCVSAIINNGIGTIGAAPDCRVLGAKFTVSNAVVPCDGAGTFQFSWLVSALAWGETQGARVSNNSNGLAYSSSVASKYASTYANGMVHFSSAGNDGANTIGFPASLASVNAISALNRYGNRASFSNWHSLITLAAPGQSIYTTDRTGINGYSSGDYSTVDGTSFSSPYAAGVAGLLISVDPWLTAAEVESQLYATAVDLGAAGRDDVYGYGFINAYDAIAHASIQAIADVSFGPPPMTVNFQGTTARAATGWAWLFGDGEGSTEQNPTHEYTDPGQYTVELTVHTAERDYTRIEENLIAIYADTIDVGDGRFEGGVGTVDIYASNYLALQSITIPFTWDGPLNASFVSVSTVGHRSAAMTASVTSIVAAWSAATVTLEAGAGEWLAPGNGPVATLTFALQGSPPTGTMPVDIWDYSIFHLAFVAEPGEYVPVAYNGGIEVSCCQGIVGDVNADRGYEPTIGDVSFLIDHLFISGASLDCLTEADINQSGGASPTVDDLTIGDVSLLIDHLFISEVPLSDCP